jgi:tyrosinase
MNCSVPRLSFVVAFAFVLLAGQGAQASIRRDITTLSATELRDYRDAFRELQQSGEYARLAGYHGCPGYYCHNDSRIFLPWHRAYCVEFEKALQQVNPSLALHYWDWTSDDAIQNGIPRAFTDVQYMSGGTTYPNPLRRFRYQCGGRDQFTVRFPDRPFLLGGLRDRVNDAYGRTTYDAFNRGSRGLRPPHDSLHTWVGGDMGVVEWAAYDPIFWAHHSNVDRQWARWQDSSNGKDPSDPIKALPLDPFKVTVDDVLKYRQLGYTYDLLMAVGDVEYKLPPGGTVTIKDVENPALGTPLWLTVYNLPAHPAKSFRVYVFVNQPTATVDDVRPDNASFAGFFGIFGGRQGAAPKGAKHVVEPPQGQRVLDLAPAIRRVIGKGAAHVTFSVTVVATDTNGEVVELSELPFDRISVQAEKKQEEKQKKLGHE